jgi:hypothetical protein
MMVMIIRLNVCGHYQHIIHQNYCLIIIHNRFNVMEALEGIKRFVISSFNNMIDGVQNTVFVIQQNGLNSSDSNNLTLRCRNGLISILIV